VEFGIRCNRRVRKKLGSKGGGRDANKISKAAALKSLSSISSQPGPKARERKKTYSTLSQKKKRGKWRQKM